MPGHIKTLTRNSTHSCTEYAICIRPTENLQGSHWFLNICTGRRIKQLTFTLLPVLTRIIDRVHVLVDAGDHNLHRLGNPIPYGNNSDKENEDKAGYLEGVEEYNNQMEIPSGNTIPRGHHRNGNTRTRGNSRSGNTRR